MLININGISINYRDSGAGLPVILIHAFPLNQTMWDDQLDTLQNFCRTITLDLRGFGRSDAPQGPYSMDQMAADVRELMTALDIDRAVLVGLSMGGYISLAFYRSYPGAVLALVLADTRPSEDTHDARDRRLKSAEKAEREGVHAIAEDMIPLLLGQTTLARRPSIVEQVRSIIGANSSHGVAAAQRGMAARQDSIDMLAAIGLPTLVVVGAEDALTGMAETETWYSRIPGARLRVIEAAGHLSNLENPSEFNAALIEFLASLNAR